MEIVNAEIVQVEGISTAAHDESMQELNEVQLALIGGGSGIVVVQ